MFRLYVKCPYCNTIFPSGFQAESSVQLIGFRYLCDKCRRIFRCFPRDYLVKINDEFQQVMKKEEIFSLPPPKGVLIAGPDLYALGGEVSVDSGKRLGSNRAIVVLRKKKKEKTVESKQKISKRIRNNELLKLLKEIIYSLMDALDIQFFSEYGSWYDRIRTIIEGDVTLVAQILSERPDLKNEKLAKCLVNIRKFSDYVIDSDFSRKPPHASTKQEYLRELTFVLTKLFEKKEELTREGFYTSEAQKRVFSEILENEYLKYETYLYDDSVKDFLICPIENFVGSKELNLGKHGIIREITQDEFHHLVETKEKIEGEFPESYPEFILSLPLENNPIPHVELVLTALRLLRKEKVGLSKIYYGFAFPHRPWRVLEAPELSRFVRNPKDSLYLFSEIQNTKLIELLSLLDKNKGVGYLTIAIRRFNFAYQRENIEDSWIDYFISLESLYSKISELTEVTHRIATRASRVLANNYEDRVKQKKKIKKWYTLRSKIVHGIKVNLDQEQLQELADCLKKSIVWFLDQKNVDHDKIIDKLDLG